jgi:RNA polymerase sigma-70 factor (ECF subfamily)
VPPNDIELLDRWKAGEQRAGEQLFERHFDALYRFFRNKVGDDSEELLQRALMACVEQRDKFRGESSFRSFMFGVARIELLNYFKRKGRLRRREAVLDTSVHDLDPSPSAIVAGGEEQRIMLEALRRIPVDLQIAIELFYWEELSTPEIAEALDIPTGTVKSRLRRAKEHLEGELAELARSPELLKSTMANLDGWAAQLRDVVRK